MIILITTFLILTFAGISLIRTLISENRLAVIIPAGFFFAIALYITLLNFNYRLFPGSGGMILSSIEILTLGVFAFFKLRRHWDKLDLSRKTVLPFFLLGSIILIFSFIRIPNTLSSAETAMQWSYAGSFAKGNYPLMTPWQPDIPPNYHLGTYLFEGALYNLSGLPFMYIQAIFNAFLFAMNLLFAIFLFWQKKYGIKNLWLIIAGLTLFFSFGIIILAYPNFSLQSLSMDFQNADNILQLIPAKQARAGAPLIDINFLSFLPARSLSLGLSFLTLYFMIAKFKYRYTKIVSLAAILSIMSFIEESIFLPVFTLFGLIFLLSVLPVIKPAFLKKQAKNLLILITLTAAMAAVHGGFIYHNTFEREESVYKLLLPSDELFRVRLDFLRDVHFIPQNFNIINIFVPSPIWLILILAFYALIKKDKVIGALVALSVITLISYLSANYIYCRTCPMRLQSHAYLILGYGFIFMLFQIFKNLSLKQNIIGALILFPFLFIPTLIPVLISETKILKNSLIAKTYKTVLSNNSPLRRDAMIEWASKNLPPNSRILVVGREFPSPTGSINFMYGGLYTLYGPQFVRVNRQGPGPEFFDAALTLNPSILKKTNVGYIYLTTNSPAFKYLPEIRKKDLSNKNFFEELYSLDVNEYSAIYKIYRVNPQFLDPVTGGREIEDGTLEKLQKLIPVNSTVYINDYPDLSFWYNMAVSFALKNRMIAIRVANNNIDPPYNGGYGLIETTFNSILRKEDSLYDFYILPPDKSPEVKAELIWSNMFASAWKRK